MAPPSQLRVVQLTPPGRGAVATLRLLGESAVERLGECCRLVSPLGLTEQPLRRIRFARCGEEPAEEVVVSRLGPEVVELHCHGGQAAVARILSQLQGLGFKVIAWEQEVVDSSRDPLAAQARIALAAAPTRRTAAILLDQLQGALRRALQQIADCLEAGAADAARQQIDALLDRARLGARLTHPWRIVLRGAPNVGKSSLANALLGFTRAIVAPTPGTTRDVVTAATAFEGWPVEFADTAGERNTLDPLEQAGVARAQAAAAAADLVLEVHVAQGAAVPAKAPVAPSLVPTLWVFNKLDLLPPDTKLPTGLAVSALTGQGLARLERAIVAALAPNPPPRGAAVPFRAEQGAALTAAKTALDRGDSAQALQAVRGLLGSDWPGSCLVNARGGAPRVEP